ncbi:MAG: hypothetical protein ACRDYX_12435 [Egibacteraceae bacterium]
MKHGPDPGFVQVDPADTGFADLTAKRQLVQGVVGDERGVDAVQDSEEALEQDS